MNESWKGSLVVLLGLCLAACSGPSGGGDGGGGGGDEEAGSCMVAFFNYCTDYSGTGWTIDDAQDACESQAGVGAEYDLEHCDAIGSVGTCVLDPDSLHEKIIVYYDTGFTAETAHESCDDNAGTWVP